MNRKHVAIRSHAREPNGRLSRAAEYAVDTSSPAAAKRVRDAALRGMAAPEWGTELGRLFLNGDLDASQYVAGKRWTRTVARYHDAIGANAMSIAGRHLQHADPAMDPDPESEEGRRRLKRARQAIVEMLTAVHILQAAGNARLHAVRAVCEHNACDLGASGIVHLWNGLAALVGHWNLRAR